ncbi:hypothetical protein QV65_33140, partial [Rhodococcus erythropolis]
MDEFGSDGPGQGDGGGVGEGGSLGGDVDGEGADTGTADGIDGARHEGGADRELCSSGMATGVVEHSGSASGGGPGDGSAVRGCGRYGDVAGMTLLPVRFAPVRFASVRSALVRFASVRFAL